MNILMIPSTMLPFPPVKGGAVQNLMKSYVEYNEKTGNHNLSVLSIYDSEAVKQSQNWKNCKVDFIYVPEILFKLRDNNNSVLTRIGFKAIHYYYINKIKTIIRNRYQQYDKVVLDNTPQFAMSIADVYKGKIAIHIYNDYLNSTTKDIDEILKRSSEIITVSDYISDCVLQTNLIDNDKVFTLHNGVELNKFGTEHSRLQRHELRKQLGISDDDFVFIFVARLVPEKGIKELITAFNALNNSHAHLVVVGNKLYSGEITDPFLLELKSIAETNKDRIHFTGYVPYDILPDYYSMADVGVLPSLYEEPFALAAIEYMASGLAVILSDAGGFPEMAKGDSAIIVKRGDGFINGLTDSMQTMLTDPEKYRSYCYKGFQKSREFSSQAYCEKLEQILVR